MKCTLPWIIDAKNYSECENGCESDKFSLITISDSHFISKPNHIDPLKDSSYVRSSRDDCWRPNWGKKKNRKQFGFKIKDFFGQGKNRDSTRQNLGWTITTQSSAVNARLLILVVFDFWFCVCVKNGFELKYISQKLEYILKTGTRKLKIDSQFRVGWDFLKALSSCLCPWKDSLILECRSLLRR